jgi:hypothetical protein
MSLGGLPIPTSLRGWACAIVLLLILFISYYLYVFPILHDFYFGQESGSPTLYSTDSSGPSPDGPPKCGPLRMRVDSPRQIAPFSKRWVYLTVSNTISMPIDVTASLVISPSSGWYMPFLFVGSSNIETLSFSPLAPYATAHGQIPLFSSDPISPALSIHIVYIYEDQPQECSIPVAQPPLYNPRRSLVHSFIEQILLPPWSNWFLAALGLIIPALVDSREREEKKPPSGEENPPEKRPPNGGEHSKEQKRSTMLLGQSLWQIFRTSLGLSLILVAGILLIVSAIWWPNEAKSGGGWNAFIIIVMLFLVTPIFTWRTLDLDLPPCARECMRNKPKWQRVLAIIIIIIIIAMAALLVCGFYKTRFPLLKPLIGISLAAMALEIPRAIPWLFERIKIKRLLAIVKSKGGNP